MKHNYSKLRGKVIELFGTQGKFAEALGVTDSYVSMLLNGKIQWTQELIDKACDLLDITVKEIGAYFFAK